MRSSPRIAVRGLLFCIAALMVPRAGADAGRVLNGHVPQAARELLPISDVPGENRLQLAIGLPLRDPAGLDAFLASVSDPASPNFRHYLTPEQFAERFGPTQDEYQAVINFSEASGLHVTATHVNRLIVDVSGSVTDVQRTFHIRLRTFRHPTENRTFFAPDVDPEIDVPVPISHIGGLTNYWIPKPQSRIRPLGMTELNATPRAGSGPGGTFRGNDFRAAYVPGVSLNGAGQIVGLLEFDGYNPNDITSYEQDSGIGSVPLENVFVNGYSGRAGSDNGEVCLDIEVAIAIAPGLAKVIVYEAPNASPWEDILSSIANDNRAKALSCSWGGGPPSSTAENIFRQMASQGQTFFNASGDDGAFVGSVPFPSDSPNVVQVGGTELFTLSAGGAYSSETVWNWGSGSGSGGGISTFYGIPSWQTGVSMVTNQGSTTFRNSPDVALTADNVYTVSDNGQPSNSGGTSCAAPLWAGFTALVNQLTANNGQPPVGYINPVLYSLALSNQYSLLFHDITSGNNINSRSAGRFSAVRGYDLCTGWGTPTATLISVLGSPGTPIPSHTINVSANPANGGILFGGGAYLDGTNVTVIATPNLGFAFTNWTENGNVVSTSPSYGFTVNADRNLIANFQMTAVTHTITVSVSPVGSGFAGGAGIFLAGSQRTVTASPANRRTSFSGWFENGVMVTTSPAYSFVLDRDRNLVAQFVNRRARRRR